MEADMDLNSLKKRDRDRNRYFFELILKDNVKVLNIWQGLGNN